ncbi:glucosaminidase domain-containing protein [Candidatus Puniceispirillum sp.]|uniref:glucosaminidase domain-containing protein n=1 Tax=Candidatus Puniceispirillum sp. TaxID=2026719 RepID=UPI003F69DBD7
MTDRLNLLLHDKNIVRLTLVLMAVIILVPGVFKVAPPQWLHAPSPMVAMIESDSGIGTDMSVAASPTPETDKDAKPDVDMVTRADTDIASSMPVTSTNQQQDSVTPKVPEIGGLAQVQTPRESIIEALKTTKARNQEAPAAKVPPIAVARNFVRVIPASHAGLATTEQKENFINMVLPLILASNEEIKQRRAAIRRAYDRQDAVTLGKWATLYKLPIDNVATQDFLNELLARADVIPVPLALAQAAIESGWGTSRFARQGNALFGQWAWQEDDGIKPLNASNKNAVVRSFPNLLGSVRAYMHNLNTHQAYQSLRDSRKRHAGMPDEDKANILVGHLHNYAEIGTKYVKDLKIVMRKNKLRTYANAYLS